MLIFKGTMIPEIHKSPGEILNLHKYRTNLPCIDFGQNACEDEVDNLVRKCESKQQTGEELPKLDIGSPVLYNKIPDSTKIKQPQWVKGTIKNRQNPSKYEILTDDSDQVIMRSRRHVPPKESMPPKHLIEN